MTAGPLPAVSRRVRGGTPAVGVSPQPGQPRPPLGKAHYTHRRAVVAAVVTSGVAAVMAPGVNRSATAYRGTWATVIGSPSSRDRKAVSFVVAAAASGFVAYILGRYVIQDALVERPGSYVTTADPVMRAVWAPGTAGLMAMSATLAILLIFQTWSGRLAMALVGVAFLAVPLMTLTC